MAEAAAPIRTIRAMIELDIIFDSFVAGRGLSASLKTSLEAIPAAAANLIGMT